jgi:methionine-R-sulfoxide reductase
MTEDREMTLPFFNLLNTHAPRAGRSGADTSFGPRWLRARPTWRKSAPRQKPTPFQKPSDEELRRLLTPTQYEVTQYKGTEAPFSNAYWNHYAPGIYVDVVSGEPLFSSLDKFDCGLGWPTFTKPLVPGNVRTKTDSSLFITRTEVRSALAGSHLGHVFEDGPKPTGLRYCINSAALRFIPVARLKQEGYGRYLPLFDLPLFAAQARAS